MARAADKSFDPVKGHQAPWTGILGGLLLVSFVAALALVRRNGQAGVPLPVHHLLLPPSLEVASERREFFDILGLLLLTFQFMVSWEFMKRPLERCLTLGAVLCGLGLASVAALRPDAFPGWLAAGGLTGFEISIITGMVLMLPIWLLPLAGWRRSGRTLDTAPPGRAFKTAFWRWAAGAAAMIIVLAIFARHPFYQNRYYQNWRLTFGYIFWGYMLIGLPYAFLTNWLRGKKFEHRQDPGFVLLLLGRGIAGLRWARLRRIIRDARVRTMLRDLGVKYFFLPLMVTFLHQEASNFFRHLPAALNPGAPPAERLNHLYWVIFHGLFVMDTGLSSIGYACSSRWLGNKSRSVEPFWSGWLVALACYPPFNGVVSGYLPYGRSFGGAPYLDPASWSWLSPETAHWLSRTLDMGLGGLTLLMYVVFVWATMSFGLRFSNLTHRGIITRGPYAHVRHPAYIAKNIAWWCESIRRFSSPWQFIFLLGWNCIYFARAWTEERHLGRDPAYRAYCALVDRRFIPRLRKPRKGGK